MLEEIGLIVEEVDNNQPSVVIIDIEKDRSHSNSDARITNC